MKNEFKAANDCYSESERGFMLWWARARAAALAPVLSFLTRLDITANLLTLMAFIAGILSAALLPFWHFGGLFLLLAHAALDGLDGPLARHQKKDSTQGSFADSMADQSVLAVNMIALVLIGAAGALPGMLYVFFYTLVVGFAMVRNGLRIPYTWLVRPRFVVYAWIPVELYLWPGSLNILIWLFNVLLGLKVVSGFIRIRKAI